MRMKYFLLSTAVLLTAAPAQAGWRDKCHLEPYKWFQNCTPIVQNHDAPEARRSKAAENRHSGAPDGETPSPQSDTGNSPGASGQPNSGRSVGSTDTPTGNTPETPSDPDTPNTPDTPDEPTGSEKEKKNNGWGNGDQDAPGNSGPHNNAENNHNGKSDPSHGNNGRGKGSNK